MPPVQTVSELIAYLHTLPQDMQLARYVGNGKHVRIIEPIGPTDLEYADGFYVLSTNELPFRMFIL